MVVLYVGCLLLSMVEMRWPGGEGGSVIFMFVSFMGCSAPLGAGVYCQLLRPTRKLSPRARQQISQQTKLTLTLKAAAFSEALKADSSDVITQARAPQPIACQRER